MSANAARVANSAGRAQRESPQPLDSAERLPRRPPDELSEEQRSLYDQIARGPRAAGPQLFALTDDDGAWNGPFGAMLLSPHVGTSLQQLGSTLRYGSGLSPRVREMAILQVAADWDCAFERVAHEAVAASAGDLDDEAYAAARTQLADAEVFELTTLVGYYAMLALQLRVFRVGAPSSP